jgi:hypothetical protein
MHAHPHVVSLQAEMVQIRRKPEKTKKNIKSEQNNVYFFVLLHRVNEFLDS